MYPTLKHKLCKYSFFNEFYLKAINGAILNYSDCIYKKEKRGKVKKYFS